MHYYPIADHGDMTANFLIAAIGLLFIVLLVVVIYKISNTKDTESNNNQPSINNDKSIEIIKQRYAKGEINKAEFDQLKSDLISIDQPTNDEKSAD